jgi:hypothetical protein
MPIDRLVNVVEDGVSERLKILRNIKKMEGVLIPDRLISKKRQKRITVLNT